MRALLVLLILVALGVGGFFAFKSSDDAGDSTDDQGIEISNNGDSNTNNTPGNEGPAELDEIDGEGVRNVTPNVNPTTPDGAPATVTVDANSSTGRVLGSVVNKVGKGIEGATVILTKAGGANLFFGSAEEVDRSQDLEMTTDADGAFAFEKVEAYARYTLIADHADYARVEFSPVDTTQGAEIEKQMVLNAGTRVYGLVKDVQGNVVPEAEITLSPVAIGAGPGTDNPDRASTVSDNAGVYEFPHTAVGNYVMTVSAEGYGQATIQNLNVTSQNDVERNVELDAAMLMGGLVNDQNGNGLAGAKVEAFLIGNSGNKTRTQTLAQKDGRFEFQDVGAGAYTLRASAKGFKSTTLPRANAGEMAIEIQLTPLPTIAGQVFDSEGSPVTEFTVNLRQGVRNSDLSMPVPNTTVKVKDPEGRYKITLPSPGDFMTEAHKGGFAPSVSNVFTAGDGQDLTGINITMKTGGMIRGTLVDKNGKAIAGAFVETNNNDWTGSMFDQTFGDGFPGMSTKKKARSDKDGVFVLRGLHATKYLVQIKHPEYAQTAMKNVVVNDGVETPMGKITLEKGSVVNGAVRGPGGSAISGATVTMWLEVTGDGFPLKYEVRTDTEGRYQVKGVRSGTYNISAQRPSAGGNNPFAGASDTQSSRRQIQISVDGQYQGEDFEFAQ